MNICTLRGITDKREKNLQHRVNVQTTDAHHTNRFNQPHAKISLVKVNFSAIFFGCLLQGVKIDFVCHLCAIDWNHGHKMNLQPLALDLLLWYFFFRATMHGNCVVCTANTNTTNNIRRNGINSNRYWPHVISGLAGICFFSPFILFGTCSL